MAELRIKLEAIGQPTKGKKAELIARLAVATTTTETGTSTEGTLPLPMLDIHTRIYHLVCAWQTQARHMALIGHHSWCLSFA